MSNVGTLTVSLICQATAFEKGLKQAGKTLTSTARTFERQARLMERTGKSLMLGITAPLALIGAAATKAAIEWEDAFAGVRDKVQATEAQFDELSRALRDMAYHDVPVAAASLANLAETAGTLGIQRPAIVDFVRTMADLGATTKFSGDEAATTLARFDNIMQSGQKSFDRMGSAIVALGGSLATSEAEIAAMALRLAGAGRVIGMAEHQVFALAGGLSSVGIEAQAGGTAMSKVMIQMADAVASGSSQVASFAAVAGMSAEQFKQAWQTDAASAVVSFIEGLGKIRESGGNVFAVIESLGMQEVRMRDALLRASGAGDLFRRSLELGAKAWEENIALTQKAEIRYGTLGAQLKFARNRVKELGIMLGESLAPYVNSALDAIRPAIDQARRMAEMFARLNPILRTTIIMSVLMVAAIGPAIYLYGRLLATVAAVQRALIVLIGVMQKAAFAFAAWQGGAATLGEALKFLVGGKIGLVILGIGALIAATILITRYWDQLSAYASAAWSAVGAAALYGASLVVRGVGLILSAIGAIIPAVRGAAQSVIGLADTLKASAASSWASAKTTASSISSMGKAAQSQADLAKGFRDMENSARGAADMQDELGKAVEGAAKSAGKNIQSFDEVHQLQDDMGKSTPELDIGDMLDFGDMVDFTDMLDFGGLAGGVADLGDAMGEQLGKITESASAAWERLKQAMEPVNRAVQWIIDNWPTIGPIIEGIASIIMLLLIPALVKSGIEALIAAGKHVLAWVMSGGAALKQAVTIIGQLAAVIAKWAWAGIQALIHAGKIVLAWAMQGWEAVASVAKQIGQFIIVGAKWVWLGIKATVNAALVAAAWIVQGVEAVASAALQVAQFIIVGAKWVWLGITAMANAAVMAAAWVIALGPVAWITAAAIALAILIIANWDWIKEKTIEIWGIVAAWLSDKWEWLKDVAKTAWEWIGEHVTGPIQDAWDWLVGAWENIGTWLSGTWDNIKNWAGEKWEGIKESITDPIQTAWTWLENTWDSIAGFLGETWGGIKETAGNIWKGIANTVIGFINRIVDGLNWMIEEMNKLHWDVPDWVPVIGGKSFGFDLPTLTPIAPLAVGTSYVPQDMLAYLHRGEAVVPKAYNAAASGSGAFGVSEEAIERAVYRALIMAIKTAQATSSSGHDDNKEIVLKLDNATLARQLLPALRREAQRQGFDLIIRPQGG